MTWNTPSRIAWNGDLDASTTLGVISYRNITGSLKLVDLYIPFSYLTLLFSILPLLAFRSIRRRHRARRVARLGLCPKCGYDLRAHQSGTAGPLCPECGTPVARLATSPQRGEAL